MGSRFKKWIFRGSLVVLSIIFILPVSGASVYYENGVLGRVSDPAETETEPADDLEVDDWTQMDDWDFAASDIEISEEFTPKKVCENSRFIFWYDTAGADIYLLDKNDGHIWSNTVDSKYYTNEDADKAMMTQLLQLSICDGEGGVTLRQLCDAAGNADDFDLTPEYNDSGMILRVKMKRDKVAFEIKFTLTEKSLSVSIPADSIEQEGGDRIMSIALMSYFGAARTDESGYILIPDGSGALISFRAMEQQEPRVYSYPIYGEIQQNPDILRAKDEQDVKNMMLPVYGIRGKSSGYLAGVTAGAENTTLNIVPYGFQAPMLGRGYFTLNYLYTETVTVNGKNIEEIMPGQELCDREVEYFLLDSGSCDYSEMAAVWRNHLEKAGVLNKKAEPAPAVSLDLFMGVKKTGMFFDSVVKMTTFQQAREIISGLKKSGVSSLDVTLLGWNKGGYTVLPTAYAAESLFGGKRALNSLTKWLSEQDIRAYLYNNYWEVNTSDKTANLRKDIVRDYVGNIITGKSRTFALMNISKTLSSRISSARKTGLFKNAAFSFARAGQWLWANHEKGSAGTRTKTMETCETQLAACLDENGAVQVYGGNQYVLKYAGSLREIPDASSGYLTVTESVPFYQMVVSGYANYTSIAGNMSYDFEFQKLKWVEYGSTPYFILSGENARALMESDYDKLFSSEYSVWGSKVKEVAAEFDERLREVRGGALCSHTRLTKTLSCVEYDNGYRIYINFGTKPAQAGGTTIPARDYVIVNAAGEGGVH